MTENTFAALGVPAPLLAVLAADGKTEPFPIQTDTLPDTLAGRDVLGRGKTGSGKTLAFSLPMAARLGGALAGGKRRPGHPLGLILAPTRELATQISAVLTPFAAAYGLTVTTIFGGISQNRQVAALKAGVDIVVACPGRLEDLMQQGFVSLDAVEITVLDEADHMADLGFLPVVTRIMSKTPERGQRMLFSATLDNGVDKIVKRFLHNETVHSVDDVNAHIEAMTHHVFEVSSVDAKSALVRMLASGTGRRILFMRTKHHAKKLAKQLTEAGIPSVDLHGNLSQPQRDRNLAAFGDGSVNVLVATDVAARGVHVDNVELVIHVDPPTEHKAYLHRSGRTARAGSAGDVVTVVLPAQRSDVRTLLHKAAIAAVPQQVDASSAAVTALVGEIAPYVKPVPKQIQQQGSRPIRQAQGKSRGGTVRQAHGTPIRQAQGKSQGANARRKRAARDDRTGHNGRDVAADRPRRDRSGRPAAGDQPARQGSGKQQRSGQQRPNQGGSGRSSHLRVGSLVGGNAGTGRGRGSRRAQG